MFVYLQCYWYSYLFKLQLLIVYLLVLTSVGILGWKLGTNYAAQYHINNIPEESTEPPQPTHFPTIF